jgi:hypothetical protein
MMALYGNAGATLRLSAWIALERIAAAGALLCAKVRAQKLFDWTEFERQRPPAGEAAITGFKAASSKIRRAKYARPRHNGQRRVGLVDKLLALTRIGL